MSVARATFWSAVGVYTNSVLSLAVAAVLSRLLTPDDFGMIAMITVVTGFMNIFSAAGIGSATVQFRTLSRRDHQTTFTLSLLLGVMFALLLLAFCRLISIFFNSPALEQVAIVMSLGFVFSALGIVPRGLLQRDMRFQAISVASVFAAAIAGGLGVVTAFAGWGFWALVAQTLANSLLASCFYMILARLAPKLSWDTRVINEIFSYAGNLTLFSVVNYWARNLDNLLIGKFLGSSPLGYYNRAYQLMMVPLSMLTQVVAPVLHASLAEQQEDLSSMYKGYLKVVRFIGLISIPAMAFAVMLAPELVRVVWGKQWESTIPVFAVLGLNGMFQPIMSTTGTVFLTRNKADWLFRCGLVSTVVLCLGILLGLPYGIMGVAVGYTIASNLWVFPLMYIVFEKLLEGRFLDFIVAISKPLIFVVFLTPAIGLLLSYSRGILADIGVLAAAFVFLFSTYALYLYRFEREFVAGIFRSQQSA